MEKLKKMAGVTAAQYVKDVVVGLEQVQLRISSLKKSDAV